MPVSLKIDKYLNNLGYYLLEDYLLFPTVPRKLGSVMSVNENEYFKNRLTLYQNVEVKSGAFYLVFLGHFSK